MLSPIIYMCLFCLNLTTLHLFHIFVSMFTDLLEIM